MHAVIPMSQLLTHMAGPNDTNPQEQGNKIELYGLRKQDPTKTPNRKVKHKVAMTQVMTLLLKLVMLVMLTGKTMAHKSMKVLPTKRGGADAELAMDNETLH